MRITSHLPILEKSKENNKYTQRPKTRDVLHDNYVFGLGLRVLLEEQRGVHLGICANLLTPFVPIRYSVNIR